VTINPKNNLDGVKLNIIFLLLRKLINLFGKYAYRSGSDGPNDIFSLLNMSGCSPKKKNELGIFYEITTHCLGNHVTFH